MNLNLYIKELKDYRLSILVWCVGLSGLIILGMSFYPVLSMNNLMTQMSALFEAPLMKGLFAAFGVDPESLMSLGGYYEVYISIYLTLMGCIASVMIGSGIISKEENKRTAEYLFARPLTRGDIFISKTAAFFTFILIINICITGSGIIGMEIFKTENALMVTRDKYILGKLEEGFKTYPDQFVQTFGLTEEDYIEFLLRQALRDVKENPGLLEEEGIEIDVQTLELLIEQVIRSPEGFMEEVKQNPEKYMQMFSIPPEEYDTFMTELTRSEQELDVLLKALKDHPERYVELFESDPAAFLAPYKKSPVKQNELKEDFHLNPEVIKNLFVYYSIKNYFILSLYVFLLIMLTGVIGLFISVFMKRGQPVTGVAVGIIFGFYFMNSISGISPQTDVFGYVSPFKFADTHFSAPGFGLEWWRVAYFVVLIIALLTVSLVVYRKKDILV